MLLCESPPRDECRLAGLDVAVYDESSSERIREQAANSEGIREQASNSEGIREQVGEKDKRADTELILPGVN
jgi:hypothetical protein